MRIIIYSAKYFYTFFSLNHAYVTYITYLKKQKRLSENSIISQTAQPVCNPIRGRVYMCVAGSGGGTRFARLPPVIEIIPRSGYRSHLSPCTDIHRVRHTACTRHRGYPDRGYTPTRHVPIYTESDTQDAPGVVATPIGVTLR